jgi:glycosyltransferase involved in cell wall biosynthesis
MIGRTDFKAEELAADIRPAVVFTGVIDYEMLQDAIAACDAMLLPLCDNLANRGRWPSKICDYLAAGRPVVACAVGDLVELFSNERIGILTKDEPDAFAKAILTLLDDDLEAIGQNARTTAERELDWAILTAKLESFYLKMLGNPTFDN